MSRLSTLLLVVAATKAASAGYPLPNERQLNFMDMETIQVGGPELRNDRAAFRTGHGRGRVCWCGCVSTHLSLTPPPHPLRSSFLRTQFMHFGIPTFWDPPPEFLYGANRE